MFTTINLQYMITKTNTPIFLKCFSKICFMQKCVDFQGLSKDTQLPKTNSNNIQNHLIFLKPYIPYMQRLEENVRKKKKTRHLE